jgi:hypothetical protein
MVLIVIHEINEVNLNLVLVRRGTAREDVMSKVAEQAGEQHLYSKSDAARRLGSVSISLLDKHLRNGSLRGTRIGRRIFISHQELNRVAKEGLPGLGAATNPNGDAR